MSRLLALCAVLLSVISVASADESRFRGWDFLVRRLKEDKIDERIVDEVYTSSMMPRFEFVPFSLKPKETHEMYISFQRPEVLIKAKTCIDRYQKEFDSAQKIFGVPKGLIAAIIVVETRCGESLGHELVVNRLSRVSSVDEPENLKANLERLKIEDPSVTYEAVEARARYLIELFYPELKTLLTEGSTGAIDVLSLRGSSAGAFGMPQFLPSTFLRFGVDADRDGKVSLFEPADAIWSVGHFFAAFGWNTAQSEEEKRAIIWRYNRSDPYIDSVLRLSQLLP